MTHNQKTPGNSPSDDPLAGLSLGKSVSYDASYAPELLQGVPRSLSREQINLCGTLPFTGADLWTGYELSWLNPRGKPQVAILRCSVPYNTPNLIESKSFKLYLNSFNQHKVESPKALEHILTRDLSACAGGEVSVEVILPEQFSALKMQEFAGENIDSLDIEITEYDLVPEHLGVENPEEVVTESLNSHLLKSNCLITDQPDWGSVEIRYTGAKIDREGLLRYLISFRQHNEFHEQCVERIFSDIQTHCRPQKLFVYARYTRRGGLDINPYRTNFQTQVVSARHARQ